MGADVPTQDGKGARTTVRLRLYILSNTPPSDAAIANLSAIAESHLAGRFELEVVDVRDEPLRALTEGALMVPTLVLITEKGDRRVIGDLRDTQAVLRVLGLTPASPPPAPPDKP